MERVRRVMRKNIWHPLAQGFLIFFAMIVLVSSIVFVYKFAGSEVSESLNEWSSYSDCLTTLFAFISLTFIYLTYKTQSDSNYKLQFDSTFFNMLQVQREILRSFDEKYFQIRSNCIKCYYPADWGGELSKSDALKRISGSYCGTMQNTDDSSAMHYFRHLYHIIKLVKNSSFNEEKQKEYIDIIQAQMSNEELHVMFYNVVNFGNSQYISWLDHFRFFENIRSTGTLFDKIKRHFFTETVFKYGADRIDNNELLLNK